LRGRYVVLEGPDGCGKSEQAGRLARWLAGQGRRTLHVREPGSTPFAEMLRGLLLAHATGALDPFAEALLFTAARSELVRREIRPAVASGTIVIAERCYLSTWVYQGLALPPAERVDAGLLRTLTARAMADCWPDRILVLDADPATCAQRSAERAADRFESRGPDFAQRVREGFLAACREEPRAVRIDASGPVTTVQQALEARIRPLLEQGP
jgi:dTMP kinase